MRPKLSVGFVLLFVEACSRPPVSSSIPIEDGIYRVRLAVLGEGVAVAGSMSSSVELDGELEVADLGSRAALVQFDTISEVDVRLMGLRVPTSSAVDMLVGKPTYVAWAEDGTVTGFRHDEKAPGLLRELHQLVVLEAGVCGRGPADERWACESRSSLGVGPTQFERLAGSVETLERQRRTYSRLRSGGDPGAMREMIATDHVFALSMNRAGQVRGVVGRESFAGDKQRRSLRFELHWLRSRTAHEVVEERPRPPELVEPGELGLSTAERRALLEQQAGMVTRAQVLSSIDEIAILGVGPENNERFWRSTGRIALEESLIPELRQKFEIYRRSPLVGGYILDLLAGAESEPAEAEFLSIMRSLPGTISRDIAADYLVRPTFVRYPSAQVGDYVIEALQTWADGPPDRANKAITYAAGAVAAQLRAADTSARVVAALTERYRRARHPHEQAALLGGLGNAGRDVPWSLVRTASTSTHAIVREALAVALRNDTSTRGEEVLLALMAGPSSIQILALKSLRQHGPSSRAANTVLEQLKAGRFHPGAYSYVLDCISVDPAAGREARAIVAADPRTPAHVRQRIGLYASP